MATESGAPSSSLVFVRVVDLTRQCSADLVSVNSSLPTKQTVVALVVNVGVAVALGSHG